MRWQSADVCVTEPQTARRSLKTNPKWVVEASCPQSISIKMQDFSGIGSTAWKTKTTLTWNKIVTIKRFVRKRSWQVEPSLEVLHRCACLHAHSENAAGFKGCSWIQHWKKKSCFQKSIRGRVHIVSSRGGRTEGFLTSGGELTKRSESRFHFVV